MTKNQLCYGDNLGVLRRYIEARSRVKAFFGPSADQSSPRPILGISCTVLRHGPNFLSHSAAILNA